MPREWKVPKSLTKFSGENGESTVGHITRYTVEIGEIASNEPQDEIFPFLLNQESFHLGFWPNT